MIISGDAEIQKYLYIINTYLKNKLCKDMKLSCLKIIKVVDKSELPIDTDAKTEGDTIYISVQSIHDAIKVVPTSELKEYLKKQTNELCHEVCFVVGNLYHEFCHMNERAVMPNIHNILLDDKYTFLEKMVAHFWIEFIVECKSSEMQFKSKTEFCDSFVSIDWDIKYFEGNRNDTNDLFWLMYTVPYFIALCYVNQQIEQYLSKIINKNTRNLIKELYIECTKLFHDMPFDDYGKIKIIGDIFENSINNNSKEYSMLYI